MADGSLTIRFLGDTSKLKSDVGELGTVMGTFEGKIEGAGSKFGNFATVASGIVAAGAIQKIGGFLKDGATGAMEDAAAMDRLKTAVENTGVSFDTRSKAIDEAIKKGQELAFSDGDVMSALTNLTNATGDSDEALRRLTLAQDLARGTGMSLEQASKLLGKTSDENTATLARYGIQLDKNATAQDVMNEVDKRFGGQAAAFAESDAGKWAQLQLQMTELQETIGGMLIPVFATLVTVFSGVMTALEPVTTFIGDNIQPIMLGLAAAIVTIVVPAFVAWAAAAVPAAIATVTAMAPVLAIAAAVGIAVAALYLAWSTNFLGIRDITQQVIDYVRPYIEGALTAIQTAFDTVLPYITTAVDTAWKAIQLVFETIFPIVQTIIETYILAWQTIIETALGVIQLAFETVWPYVQGIVETAMLAIQTAVELGTAAAGLAVDAVMGAAGTVVNAITLGMSAAQTAVDAVMGAAGTIVNAITLGTAAAGLAVDAVMGAAGTVVNAITLGMSAVQTAVDAVMGAAGTVVTAVTNGATGVYDAINGVLGAAGTVVTAVTDGIGAVKTAIETALQDTVTRAGELASDMYDVGKSFVQNLIDGIKDLLTDLNNVLGSIGDALGSIDVPGFSPPSEAGYEIGYGYGSQMGHGTRSGWRDAGSPALSDIGADLSGGAAGVPVDQAIAAATSAGSTGTGGGRSGGVVFNSSAGYRQVQMANGMTGYVATGKDDEWFGGGGLSIIMDGFRVGRLVGNRHVQGARMRRSPVGCGG